MAKVVYVDWRDFETEIVGVFMNDNDAYKARAIKEFQLVEYYGFNIYDEVSVCISEVEIQ